MRTPHKTVATLAIAALLLVGCSPPATGADRGSGSRSQGGPVSYTPEGPIPGAVRIDFELSRPDPPSGQPGQPGQPYQPDQPGQSGARDRHVPPPRLPKFYSLPWPTELLRAPNGAIDWSSFPGRDRPLISGYLKTAAADLDGFSIATAIYFHFNGAPDVARIPARASGALPEASPISLIDVDPASPERGAFIPIETRYYPAPLRHVPERTLAVKPLPGFVLRPGTLYAAVVRRDLGDSSGAPLGTSASFEAIKWTSPREDPAEERARRIHSEALNYLDSRGIARSDIAALALFRTGVPHAVTERLFDVATRLPPSQSPRIVRAEWQDVSSALYQTIRGYYCTPNFQSDINAAPFLFGGGSLSLDEAGLPRVVELPPESRYRTDECGGLIRARFILTIPRDMPIPAGGLPLLVVGHGTGGSARTLLGDDNFAGWAARVGMAAVSTDQPLHGADDLLGARPGSREPLSLALAGLPINIFRGYSMGAEIAFYNPMNAAATRDNLRQAGVDASLLARVITGANFSDLISAPLPRRSAPRRGPTKAAPAPAPSPRFDPERIVFAGHSQGSQSAAVFAAIDPRVRGVLLSGCGGDARIGVLGRKDIAIMPFIEALLELAPGELSEFHPFMTLVQGLIDPVDPQSYARLYRDPLPGRRPQNVLHYSGIVDTYSPPASAAALAVAMRATPLYPLIEPVRGLSLLGLSPARGVVRGNAGAGRATIAFVELAARHGEDGHFVLFYEPGAPELAIQFLRSAALPGGGPAEVGPLPVASRWD